MAAPSSPEAQPPLSPIEIYQRELHDFERSRYCDYLCERYFPFILFYDISSEHNKSADLPKPTNTSITQTGWHVHEHDEYVLVVAGDEVFKEYGYRKDFLDTMRQVIDNIVKPKGWITTVAEGLNETLEARVWLLMREHKVETLAFAPHETAQQLYVQWTVSQEAGAEIARRAAQAQAG